MSYRHLPFVLTLALMQSATAASPPLSAPARLAPPTTPATIIGAVQADLPSRITGHTYRILVQAPIGRAPKEGWPVVYLLDGGFPAVAGVHRVSQYSGARGALLVGIAYANDAETPNSRSRDSTPSRPEGASLILSAPTPVEHFGGADDFHRFMTEELRPWIAATWPVNAADQTLVGHSLTGLFTLHVLFHHPEAYRTFVAASPSIWFNDREVLKGEAAFADAVRSGRVAPRILITSAALEQDPPDPDRLGLPADSARREAILNALASARMIDNARELAERLAAIPGGGNYRVHYLVYPEAAHGQDMAAAVSRGLQFALAP